MTDTLKGRWALILGASSGFGGATARELARQGMNIAGVHLDRKGTMPDVEKVIADIRKTGAQAEFFNVNAADELKRAEVLDALKSKLTGGIHVLFHSLAFGTLKPFITEAAEERITKPQMEMTLDVMAHSLVYWTQDLCARKMLGKDARIFAMTSAGGERIFATYGAVSAAKAALESHCRQLAYELASQGIAVNALRAGVTDTPALRKIPGNQEMMERVLKTHSAKRLTVPEDVARATAALSAPGIAWLTGNVINVDGGEFNI